jgi:hypothetical protein
MTRTIQRMWDDEALAARLAGNGRTFAAEECSEQRTVTYFIDYARSLGCSKIVPPVVAADCRVAS